MPNSSRGFRTQPSCFAGFTHSRYSDFHPRISAETSTVQNRKPRDLAANLNFPTHILLSCPADLLTSAYVTFCYQVPGSSVPPRPLTIMRTTSADLHSAFTSCRGLLAACADNKLQPASNKTLHRTLEIVQHRSQ